MWSVFFVFLSYLDRNFVKGDLLNRALDAEKESKEMFSMLNSTFCAKMSFVGENYLYQVSDGVEEVRSVVNLAGKLVDCSVIVNQMQVKSFMHVCRLGLKEQRTERNLETRFVRMDEAKLICREFKKRPERTRRMAPAVKQLDEDENDNDSSVSQDKTVKRSKRGFTYPGTLWCGAGNMADHYDHLGEFAETDSCCRVHDHCPYVIHAFSSKYGYTNFKWHSICHCDCDTALKECLRKVNDTASRVVGQAFFNVIGVPCFKFAYEDQCAERHWYGMCKRYEKFPVAELKESVPYDFGDIDVIDVLTLAPPKTKDSKQSNEQEKPESATQSTMSGSQTGGPEQPSLRNVVTAAEDFIKVLATVSTSQSSTADPAKGETQGSEKKKRKNAGKKRKNTKKQRGKGKGRKRKPKVDTGAKTEEGAAVSPSSGSKAEEVVDKSNFISEAERNDQSGRNTNRISESEYDLGGKEEPSNEVLKDEPVMDRETVDVSTTSLTKVQKEPAAQDELKLYTAIIPLSISTSTTTVIPHKAKTRRSRKGRRKKSKITSIHSPVDAVLNIAPKEKSLVNAADNLSAISVPTVITITPTAQLEQQKFRSHAERRPVVSTASSPIVIHKVKRHRSKERAEGEGRKKRRKIGSAAPIVAVAHENSSADNLKATANTAAPTAASVPTAAPAERQVSLRPDVYGGRTSVSTAAINSSVPQTKRQRSRERGPRSRRGKIVLPLSSENQPFQNTSENVVPVLPTPAGTGVLNRPTTVVGRPTEETESRSEWGHLTTKRQRLAVIEESKPRKKAMPTVLDDRVTVPTSDETAHDPMTFTRLNIPTDSSETDETEELSPQRSEDSKQASYYMTTTSTPFMSPIQLSIQRAKEQFSRKKRRKAALSIRQQ